MEDSEHHPDDGEGPWRWKEGIFGGAMLVYLATASVTGIWWAASLSAKTQEIASQVSSMERRFDGLDNVSLGNRVTKLEVELQSFAEQQARMERKIDVLLDRRFSNPSGPAQSRDQR